MHCFKDDYSETAHPDIIAELMRSCDGHHAGYGEDEYCLEAARLIRREIELEDCDVHFLSGGTQTNLTAISSFLRPFQAAMAPAHGHILVHEAAAIEATGHKILSFPSPDGKLTPERIDASLRQHFGDEHMPYPKLVYVSDSTETGTVYNKAELTALSRYCREHGLYLYLDGARLGAALAAPKSDLTMADIAALTDAFYIGGTKNGAMLGEALVIKNPELRTEFRRNLKLRGAMLAKGWILGVQFCALFRDGLFYRLGKNATDMAIALSERLAALGVEFTSPVESNMLFPVFRREVTDELRRRFIMHPGKRVDDEHSSPRLVCSWATTPEAVDEFASAVSELI